MSMGFSHRQFFFPLVFDMRVKNSFFPLDGSLAYALFSAPTVPLYLGPITLVRGRFELRQRFF